MIEFGLTEQLGACDGEGCTEQVTETAPPNPPIAPAVTVAVELCPGLIGLGVKSDIETEKSGVKSNVALTV
ncbi:MAG: hypothetical protein AUI36_47725 [Cyanobacteria bacterium 13_1_40CM_2_61_4]|nr:MAG: hypothetical protein AUI36_47725 [Cyanobacteria bacterium 13_1_40CM_2_61_4]